MKFKGTNGRKWVDGWEITNFPAPPSGENEFTKSPTQFYELDTSLIQPRQEVRRTRLHSGNLQVSNKTRVLKYANSWRLMDFSHDHMVDGKVVLNFNFKAKIDLDIEISANHANVTGPINVGFKILFNGNEIASQSNLPLMPKSYNFRVSSNHISDSGQNEIRIIPTQEESYQIGNTIVSHVALSSSKSVKASYYWKSVLERVAFPDAPVYREVNVEKGTINTQTEIKEFASQIGFKVEASVGNSYGKIKSELTRIFTESTSIKHTVTISEEITISDKFEIKCPTGKDWRSGQYWQLYIVFDSGNHRIIEAIASGVGILKLICDGNNKKSSL